MFPFILASFFGGIALVGETNGILTTIMIIQFCMFLNQK